MQKKKKNVFCLRFLFKMVNVIYLKKCKFNINKYNFVRSFFIHIVCQINFIRLLSLFVQCLIIIYKQYQINRFRFGIIIFIFSFTICFLYTIYDKPKNNDIELLPTHIFYTNTSIHIPLSKIKEHSHRLVLIWTDLFNNYYWHQQSFFNLSTIISCSSIHQCQFTRDKRKLSKASVVGFHLYDMKQNQLPERISSKNNNQSWIFITGESPINFYYQNPQHIIHIYWIIILIDQYHINMIHHIKYLHQ